MNSQINHEKTVYECRLFSVKNVGLTLPDGKTRNYELIDIQNAVTLLPIDSEKNVYFVDQFRIGAKKTLLELPAGKVEEGEDPLLTAKIFFRLSSPLYRICFAVTCIFAGISRTGRYERASAEFSITLFLVNLCMVVLTGTWR